MKNAPKKVSFLSWDDNRTLMREVNSKRVDPNPDFPPDCADGECKMCHACYSKYVELKVAGVLD